MASACSAAATRAPPAASSPPMQSTPSKRPSTWRADPRPSGKREISENPQLCSCFGTVEGPSRATASETYVKTSEGPIDKRFSETVKGPSSGPPPGPFSGPSKGPASGTVSETVRPVSGPHRDRLRDRLRGRLRNRLRNRLRDCRWTVSGAAVEGESAGKCAKRHGR
ncbi:hypothetical protein M885DRAFT_540950 [Pelagophyceae sp. CCMP2097]|nr:hypothetical protein M885DRAFT_540950 [Pelagophyceae sp. CCMP2097]